MEMCLNQTYIMFTVLLDKKCELYAMKRIVYVFHAHSLPAYMIAYDMQGDTIIHVLQVVHCILLVFSHFWAQKENNNKFHRKKKQQKPKHQKYNIICSSQA